MTQLRFTPYDVEQLKGTAILMVADGWDELTISRQMAHSVGMGWEDLTMPEREYVMMLIRGEGGTLLEHPMVVQQPREHPVPCQQCRTMTWNINARCDQHQPTTK